MKSATAFEDKRARADSSGSKVDGVEFSCHGIRGKYSGEINDEGKPHGSGSFVRESGMTYIGVWKDGERVGNGEFYMNGRLLGNAVWD